MWALPAAMLLFAAAAPAFIPGAERIVRAIASANVAEGRTQALRISLTLKIDDGPVVATGELISHPSGLARLELRGAGELVERHLLLGTEHSASRNGEPLDGAREFLPPLFLAQTNSGTALSAALDTFSIASEFVALAPCGDHDCFVIGDRLRVAPETPGAYPIEPGTTGDANEAAAAGEPRAGGVDVAASPAATDQAPIRLEAEDLEVGAEAEASPSIPAGPGTLWIDTQTYSISKIELPSGVVVEFGPPQTQNGIQVPTWMLIHEPERAPVRMEFETVTAVRAAARSFSREWLLPREQPAGLPESAEMPDATAGEGSSPQ